MSGKPVKVGIVGCGSISGAYLKNCKQLEMLEVVACSDIITDKAKERAEEFEVPRACTVEELLADPEIEIVLNLTVPKAHAQIALASIEAGKSTHMEKPFAVTREDSRCVLERAEEKGVLVGCAPDTFMGAGLQTCRKAIDDGLIGDPVAASAFMMGHGHENWHPSPEFYYEEGGGPMFDMGPYYLTALVSMLGPVRRVTGSAKITFPTRTITSEPKQGKIIEVEVPTHIAGVMEFENGTVGTMVMSFDVWSHNLPCIEIYGTEGSLFCPNPNGFGGPVRFRRRREEEIEELPLSHPYEENWRGLGVADMACALRSGRKHRANGELAYHVLDIMHAFHDASRERKHVELESSCARPAPMPTDLPEGKLDE